MIPTNLSILFIAFIFFILYILVYTSMDRKQQQDQSSTNTLSGTCTLIEI